MAITIASTLLSSPQATGGVCKLQGSIQGVIMKHPYYAFHVQEVAYSPLFRLRPDLGVSVVSRRCIPLFRPLRLACGPERKGHTDLVLPFLSSTSTVAISSEFPICPEASLANEDKGLATFTHLSVHLTARARTGHAPPVHTSFKLIKLEIIGMNGSGKIPGVESN